MGSVVVLGIVAAGVILAVGKMARDKKKGRCCGCGGDCGRCDGKS